MTLAAALFLLALAGQSRPPAAAPPKATTCSASLKMCEDSRTQIDLKLQDEMERADVQNYLTRVELAATKAKLAAALKKCGEVCAPAIPPAPPAR